MSPFAQLLYAAEPVASAGPLATPDRLQSYSRYLRVVAEQLEALERGEMGRVQALADDRQRLERELSGRGETADTDAAATTVPFPAPSSRALLGELLEASLCRLEHDVEESHHLHEHWIQLEDDARALAREIRPPAPGRGRYVAFDRVSTRLNVRF